MDYGMATSGINSAAEFYAGVQRGRQKRQQQERQKQFYQILQNQMQAGQVRPKAAMSAGGEMSYSFPFVEPQKPITEKVGESLYGYDRETGAWEEKVKGKTFSTSVKEAAKRIKEGEDYDTVSRELQGNFPSKYKKNIEEYLKKSLPKTVFKSPKFKEGKGLGAYASKDIAKLPPATKVAIEDIENKVKTEEDFKKVVIAGRKTLEKAGVDVAAILEYFGRDEFGNKRTDVWE